ncbi:MAG: hypothetical protein PHW52_02375 [Candidatus Pacebacteria bacterium]|nr:hypothetical protein [Candidatus Paceibacterota bacterium]
MTKEEETIKDVGKEEMKEEKKMRKETDIQAVINHFFYSKGFTLDEIKENSKKKKIIYSRFTRPAKELMELAGSVEKAKEAITIVADWANSRKLDYSIETVFKKWLELDKLKPKAIVKKPYFMNQPMVWSQTKKKWFVIDDGGEWLEFAGKDNQIEWKTETEEERPGQK